MKNETRLYPAKQLQRKRSLLLTSFHLSSPPPFRGHQPVGLTTSPTACVHPWLSGTFNVLSKETVEITSRRRRSKRSKMRLPDSAEKFLHQIDRMNYDRRGRPAAQASDVWLHGAMIRPNNNNYYRPLFITNHDWHNKTTVLGQSRPFQGHLSFLALSGSTFAHSPFVLLYPPTSFDRDDLGERGHATMIISCASNCMELMHEWRVAILKVAIIGQFHVSVGGSSALLGRRRSWVLLHNRSPYS